MTKEKMHEYIRQKKDPTPSRVLNILLVNCLSV